MRRQAKEAGPFSLYRADLRCQQVGYNDACVLVILVILNSSKALSCQQRVVKRRIPPLHRLLID